MTKRRTFISIAAGLCCLGLAAGASAGPKDSDGQRKRARKFVSGSTVKDTLGEGDRSDWRYVKVEASGNMTFTVRYSPPGASVAISVADSKGKPLHQAAQGKPGVRTVSLFANPGIYYLEVAGEEPVQYSLEIKVE